MTQTKPDTHENPEWVLMAKALRGELSEQEQVVFSAWLNEDDSNLQQWTEALEVWDEVGTEHNATFLPNADFAWEKLCAKIEIPPTTNVIPLIPVIDEPAGTQQTFVPWNTLLKYAAALVIAAGFAWVAYLQYAPSAPWTQIATVAGQRQGVYLPDSSYVLLNQNSSLRYQTAFTGNERKVELQGEGFFQVRKNPNQPFVVTSGNAQTKVLGTSFNITTNNGSSDVTVTVVTGKVAFSSLKDKNSVLLTPGYTGILSANGHLQKQATETISAIKWQALEFKNMPIAEVAHQLEEYFKVTITVSSSAIQQCMFTGSFDNPELKNILSVLEASSDVKFVRTENGNYTIVGKGCQ